MSVRVYAAIFGILFIVLGILGFYPQFTPNGYMFNYFTVNTLQNVFHVVTGLIGLFVSFVSPHASRVFFKIFAVIYLFIAVLAFMIGGDLVFMRFNTADNLFHLIIGAIFAYLGFGKVREEKQTVVTTTKDDRILPEDRVRRVEHESDIGHPETTDSSDHAVHVDLTDKDKKDKL